MRMRLEEKQGARGKSAHLLLGAAAFLLLAGCAGKLPDVLMRNYTVEAPFDADQARRQMSGNGVVTGEAFMRQNGGGIVTCAAEEVELIPATEYARERFRILNYGDQTEGVRPLIAIRQITNDYSDFHQLILKSRCDSRGAFTFKGVGMGDFYLFTRVTWNVDGGTQGGRLYKLITVDSDQPVSVIMAP